MNIDLKFNTMIKKAITNMLENNLKQKKKFNMIKKMAYKILIQTYINLLKKIQCLTLLIQRSLHLKIRKNCKF